MAEFADSLSGPDLKRSQETTNFLKGLTLELVQIDMEKNEVMLAFEGGTKLYIDQVKSPFDISISKGATG